MADIGRARSWHEHALRIGDEAQAVEAESDVRQLRRAISDLGDPYDGPVACRALVGAEMTPAKLVPAMAHVLVGV